MVGHIWLEVNGAKLREQPAPFTFLEKSVNLP